MSINSQIRYRKNHPTITLTCESKQQYANIVKQSKKLNLSLSGYLKKIILNDISSFDEGKRIGSKECDGQWHEHIKEKYVKKEVATNLRSVLGEKDATIKYLTEEIEEGDEFVASFRVRNTNLIKEIGEKDNLNTNLNNKIINLNDHIENFLDAAGRRERSKLRLEKDSFAREKTEFNSACMKERNRKLELDQRDEDQDKQNKARDERDKKLNELQTLMEDQVVEQQKKATELKQKEYELKQKGDAIAAEKKDLMAFAGGIDRKLLELSKVEQKIKRNKHLLFLTADPSKRSLVL